PVRVLLWRACHLRGGGACGGATRAATGLWTDKGSKHAMIASGAAPPPAVAPGFPTSRFSFPIPSGIKKSGGMWRGVGEGTTRQANGRITISNRRNGTPHTTRTYCGSYPGATKATDFAGGMLAALPEAAATGSGSE